MSVTRRTTCKLLAGAPLLASAPALGWPVRIGRCDNGWSNCAWELPAVRAAHFRDFCVEVRAQDGGAWLYTVRVKGDEFRAPVRRAGLYAMRRFDPDGEYDEVRSGLRAIRRQA